MATNDARLIELAIAGLQAQRERIDTEIAELQARGSSRTRAAATPDSDSQQPTKRGRRRRTAAQKKAHSERMKKIWAERKRRQ
jgi:hypothetical protein